MKEEEIAGIFYNRDRVSAIDKAKRYSQDIASMYSVIQEQSAKIKELEKTVGSSGNPIKSEQKARVAVSKISTILIEAGFIEPSVPTG